MNIRGKVLNIKGQGLYVVGISVLKVYGIAGFRSLYGLFRLRMPWLLGLRALGVQRISGFWAWRGR